MKLATLFIYSALGRKLSPSFAAYVGEMVAEALAYAHAAKDSQGNELHVIHRAVGPMRIRLGFDGRVKLVNFGAAYSELRGRMQTPPDTLRGDVAYTAPEVWRAVRGSPGPRFDPLISGMIDGRVDVFSLGLVLLEVLLAEYPLDPAAAPVTKSTAPLIAAVKTELPTWIDPGILAERLMRFKVDDVEQRLESVPRLLRDIVRRSLAFDPDERPSARDVRDELRAYLGTLSIPYGAEEMARELKGLRSAAENTERFLANTIERTALASSSEEED